MAAATTVSEKAAKYESAARASGSNGGKITNAKTRALGLSKVVTNTRQNVMIHLL